MPNRTPSISRLSPTHRPLGGLLTLGFPTLERAECLQLAQDSCLGFVPCVSAYIVRCTPLQAGFRLRFPEA